jgi:hypothetical protein
LIDLIDILVNKEHPLISLIASRLCLVSQRKMSSLLPAAAAVSKGSTALLRQMVRNNRVQDIQFSWLSLVLVYSSKALVQYLKALGL